MNREPHSFRKKWGQNFLVDPNIIKKIYSAIKPKENDNIVEIGPGDGALTKVIYPNVCDMVTVEVDPCNLAKSSATKRVLPGSLTLPLYGTGLKNGESVSTNILFKGSFLATSGKWLFLNVKFPENEI